MANKTIHDSPVVFISGSASGIGLAAARVFAMRGWRVIGADLSSDAVEESIAQLDGDGHLALTVDVRARNAVDDAVAHGARELGRLDAAIPLAGVLKPAASESVSDEELEWLLDVHLLGTIRVARAAYPFLKDTRGSIVGISSMGASLGLAGRLGYNAAKAGVEAVMRTLAVEWAEDGIRANAVAPAWVKTPAIASLIERGFLNPLPVEKRTPMNRFAYPSEIGEVIEFLASERSSFVTGTVVKADGGMSVQFPLPESAEPASPGIVPVNGQGQ